MSLPRKQYVLARTRGRSTQYFYGPRIGQLIITHIRVGDSFAYAAQFTRNWHKGTRTSETHYSTER